VKNFHCDSCWQPIFFENVQCVTCQHTLGFLPDLMAMSALEPADTEQWRALAPQAQGRLYRMCQNYHQEQVCNWMVPVENPELFCQSCRLNKTVPNLSQPQNRTHWQRLETAKRRLVYSLLSLGLPLLNKQDSAKQGLAFAFLADPDPSFKENAQVMTGHANGLITINVAEADDAVREKTRLNMNEVYRTVLGHFRHEIGHYYWERLIRYSNWLTPYRERFGDEREDYNQALQRHYEQGPQADWQQRYISAYASVHSWEDWAETWAHYLHMVDTLETAVAFGLTVKPREPKAPAMKADLDIIGRQPEFFDKLLENWLALTFAINSINRSMGQKDLYPFILSDLVIAKLRFVHDLIHEA
jgi:hypothetical protein